jgi:hypothetical protein
MFIQIYNNNIRYIYRYFFLNRNGLSQNITKHSIYVLNPERLKVKKIVMIHKVRIFNPSGKILKVISSEALSKRHWVIFEDGMKPIFQK